MLRCQYAPYTLHFAFKALTSRGALPVKPTWFIKIWDTGNPELFGYGEIALFPGLSAESASDDFEPEIRDVCALINRNELDLSRLIAGEETGQLFEGIPSSIRFGIESAVIDIENRLCNYSEDDWISGKEPNVINGLIWMGDYQTMLQRIRAKLDEGFQCLKLKIGGIDFQSECQLLEMIRRNFSKESLVLRLDANGSFTPENALERLERLSEYDIHSIEQPIRQGQWQQMRRLCENSPIDIALDEELIGVRSDEQKYKMLNEICPQYIILKPSLCGGFSETVKWMSIAKEAGIKSWLTSALETNVGLRPIAQYAFNLQNEFEMWMPQGLGTGEVFTNNIPSGIYRKGQELWYDPKKDFYFSSSHLNWIEP